MPDCSIVIPVLNNASLTRGCLDAVLSCGAGGFTFEIIVVDDGSTDSTAELLAGYGDKVRVVRHEKNTGFATACNDGARIAAGKDLVFLNYDTVPQKGWLDKLCRYAEEHPAAAVVGAKMLFPDNTVQHAGVVVCQDYNFRHIYAGFSADHPAVNKSRRFQIVTAGCALVRREPFEQAGGFDPAFYNGYEDVDLCLRLGEKGHEIHYCHESVLYHLESVALNAQKNAHEIGHRNYCLCKERWADKVKPDDIRYYIEDGLLRITYNDLYPFDVNLSPALALIRLEDREREADRLLNTRARQVHDLLRENVRLSLRVREADFRAKSASRNGAESTTTSRPERVSAEPQIISKGEVHWLSNETSGRLISVLLPVKNGADRLRELLPKVLAQKTLDQVEIVAVDSGSADETIEVLRQHAATIVTIPPEDFDHGLTRNLLTRYARGSIYVFMSQNALPADEHWLANLVAPLGADPMIAGVCSRVLARPDADFLTRRDVQRDPDGSSERHIRMMEDPDRYRQLPHHQLRLLINFHTQSTAIRPTVFARIPFRQVVMGEDILWAKEVIEAGYKIQHEPSSVVLHSHSYSCLEHFKRHFDDGLVNRQIVGRKLDAGEVVPIIEQLVREDWGYLKNECGLGASDLEHWQIESALRRTAQTVGEWLGVNSDCWKGDAVSLFSLTEHIRSGKSAIHDPAKAETPGKA